MNKLEGTKGVIRSHKSRDRQYSVHTKRGKQKMNNDLVKMLESEDINRKTDNKVATRKLERKTNNDL